LAVEKLYNGNLPDFYIHNKNKRFNQVLSLLTDIVETFLGAFNAYEIQQLKSKYLDISKGQGHKVKVNFKFQNS
jgi:hypothetical protein